MLLSMVFMLRPVADCCVPMTLGKAIHACFLQMVRRLDPDVGLQLHGADRQKPFTTSPLQGPFEVRGHRLLLKHDREYWLRVTSLEAGLSELLLRLEDQPPQFLNLLEATFAVLNVSSDAHVHAWARRSSYEELQVPKVASEPNPRPKVGMAFASPTAFRSQGQTVLLPLPRLVFSSLWERWQRYAPVPLETALLETLVTDVDIARYKLQTQMMDFGSYRQLGFVGECEFFVRKCVSEEVMWGLQVLVDFALFAGVGYKTTMGLGQARRIT
jgi:CRISPR-associated endoribonuclease Cas6